MWRVALKRRYSITRLMYMYEPVYGDVEFPMSVTPLKLEKASFDIACAMWAALAVQTYTPSSLCSWSQCDRLI